MVLTGRFALDYGIELESFLNGLLLLDALHDLEIALTILVVSNNVANSIASQALNFHNLRFLCQNVTPLSQVINHHISSNHSFCQRFEYRFQEAELHRNQNKTVKNASCNTLCLLNFPNIEQNKIRKHEISLLGGSAIMFSKS